jgi:hypothetical protein
LHCQFFSPSHQPLVGEKVKVSGGGASFELITGDQGEIDTPADPGAYQLAVRGQTFKAHTLHVNDMSHPRAGLHYQFVVDTDEEDDWSKHEKGRMNRYSSGEDDDADAP